MGYGTGALLCTVSENRQKVINFAGDGSFRMNCNELATAVNYKLPIIIAVLNNSTLGMVRQWQTMFYGKDTTDDTGQRPGFCKVG